MVMLIRTKSKAKDKEPPRKIESVASIKEMHAKEIEDVSKGKKPEKVVAKKTAAKKKPTPNKFRSCLLTFLQLSDITQGNTRLVPMEEDVFGIEHQEIIGMEDFEQIFEHTQLGLGVIDTYIRFLYEKLMHPSGLRQRFAFLAPFNTNLGLIISKPNEVMAYVLNRFMASINSEKLFFLPFNTGNGGHWLLVAINPIREVVYFLDSLHNPISTYEAMKELVDTVIQVFRAQRGSQVPKSKANNITWIRVECPGQRNEVDCDFYMLQFMKESLLSNQIEIPSKI
ncbi:uncharacterized protein LOC131658697 [Vicia villosa]|uniref:uncharacterized protein LOC131658697 n=1 Tax=Vicia villosa TaxID=3911 RepID=UPI00273AF980|nr:uncharacterized protein LOC131658697 [Vicia villosa]